MYLYAEERTPKLTHAIPIVRNLLWAEGAFFCLGTPQIAYQLYQRNWDPAAINARFLFLQNTIYLALGYLFLAGLAALVAAHAMEQNRTWMRTALQVASVINMPVMPLGTIFGVYGLWLAFNPRAGAALAYHIAADSTLPPGAVKVSAWPGRSMMAAQALTSLVLVPLTANYLKSKSMPTMDYISFVVCFLLAVLVGILCHETGHLVAGKLSGLQFLTLAAGPLVISRLSDGWRWQLVNSRGLWNGVTVMSPSKPHRLRSNAVFFVLGGPVGSLICGAGALSLMLAGPELHMGQAAEFFGILGVIELVNSIANLIPLQVPGGYTDGARLLQLFRKDAEGIRFLAELAFGLSDTTSLRPRDWHEEWIKAVTEDQHAPGFSRGCYHAYVYHLDRGDVDEASIWLARCMDSHRALKRDPYRWILAIENAFFEARHLKNLDAAQEWLNVPRAGIPAERFTELRVQAAIHIAEGERDKARLEIEAALRLHAGAVETGRQQYERAVLLDVQNWFDDLTGAGSLSRLAQALRERDELIQVAEKLEDKPSRVQKLHDFLRPEP